MNIIIIQSYFWKFPLSKISLSSFWDNQYCYDLYSIVFVKFAQWSLFKVLKYYLSYDKIVSLSWHFLV